MARAQRGRHGRGGYQISQRILQLADRYGSSVVAGAMAQTARYGNYSAEAVARVIAGKAPRAHSPRTAADGLALAPESVRRCLEAMDVEQRDLGHFDKLLDRWDDDSNREGGHEND
jgi:hypothetical protein